MTHDLQPLIDRLRTLCASEGRPGGDRVAQALGDIRTLPDLDQKPPPLNLAQAQALLQDGPDAPLAPLLPRLSWRQSGLKDGRIRPEIAQQMGTCEVLGPTGMIPHTEVKVGLFYQGPGLNYVTRTHAAEETFFVLGGTAFWSVNDRTPQPHGPGQIIHHPSMIPHGSVTKDEPTLAVWRWTGDIRFETYTLVG